MSADLKVIFYPDPRLKKVSKPVEVFDDALAGLATRLLELMREHRGVGLAAPQVGRNLRLFVMNATQQPGDDRVYVNPELIDPTGNETAEEGCLSLPGINCDIERNEAVILRAQDLKGNRVEERASGYIARVWHHRPHGNDRQDDGAADAEGIGRKVRGGAPRAEGEQDEGATVIEHLSE
jgi:peptide deformylase